jgi:hypothetical protein
VVPAPAGPDQVTAGVVAALRTGMPDSSYRLLRGCAVVSAAGDVLGWAGAGSAGDSRGRAGTVPGGAGKPTGRVSSLPGGLGDDPFDGELTPIVIALPDPD